MNLDALAEKICILTHPYTSPETVATIRSSLAQAERMGMERAKCIVDKYYGVGHIAAAIRAEMEKIK